MNKRREIRSGHMPVARLRAYVAVVCQFFCERQILDVNVQYGWACDLPIREMWQSISVKVADVPSFMHESATQGIFSYGEADLFLADEAELFQFCFCHESDVHFKTADMAALNQVADRWVAQGFKVYGINEIDPALLRDNSA